MTSYQCPCRPDHRANRGTDIGGWRVVSFGPGKAVVEKTTPYHCILEQGILQEALLVIGVPIMIEQQKCFRRGDDCCEYVMTTYIRDHRWTGATP